MTGSAAHTTPSRALAQDYLAGSPGQTARLFFATMAATASFRRVPANSSGPPRAAALHPRELWLLAAIVVIGAAIRFSTLDQQSFWLDEATTWGIASHGLGHVL